MTLAVIAGVAVLGGVGAVARFAVDALISERRQGEFPLGTFVVNVSGCCALGVLVGLALKGDAYLLGATAVLGSFTTFSTWVFEAHRLAQDGELGIAWSNVLLSLFAGLLAVELGRLVGGVL